MALSLSDCWSVFPKSPRASEWRNALRLLRPTTLSVRNSVLRDDTAKAIVHADRSHVHVLPDAIAACDCNGRYRKRDGFGAHEQVIVFQRNRPARRKADFDTRP